MHDIRAIRDSYDSDEAIARAAVRGGGVVDREMLVALGLGRGAIAHRLRVGRLHAVHDGVYVVGHDTLTPRGKVVAGLLAAGRGAVLSHRIAAYLHGILPSMPPFIDVTRSVHARRQGNLIVHRTLDLEYTSIHDLPITPVLRTLRDLAATRPAKEVERAANEAVVKRLVTEDQLANTRGRGAQLLRRLAGAGDLPTRSELERAFRRLTRRTGLPQPVAGHRIGRHTVDFCWPDHRVAVEVDGLGFHGHYLARVRDNGRDADLQAAGYLVLRFTWQEVMQEPHTVAARLARFVSPASRRAA